MIIRYRYVYEEAKPGILLAKRKKDLFNYARPNISIIGVEQIALRIKPPENMMRCGGKLELYSFHSHPVVICFFPKK